MKMMENEREIQDDERISTKIKTEDESHSKMTNGKVGQWTSKMKRKEKTIKRRRLVSVIERHLVMPTKSSIPFDSIGVDVDHLGTSFSFSSSTKFFFSFHQRNHDD